MAQLFQIINHSPHANMLKKYPVVKENKKKVYLASDEKIYVFVKNENDQSKSFRAIQREMNQKVVELWK